VTDASNAEDRISFLRSLRAVRSFSPEPVPQEVVDVLEVARWSGSTSNRQPWELVIRDRETLRKLAQVEGYARHLGDAPWASCSS
jgi:nitroreductase